MRLSNTWHLVRLWRMKSYCLARSKRDLGVTSGCAGRQCQQCSPWPCQHVADSTGLRSGFARQSHLILVTAPKLFLYDSQHQFNDRYKVFGNGLFAVLKVQVSFLEYTRRGGVEGWIFATLFSAGNVLPHRALVCPWAKLIEALADSGNAYWPRRNWSGIKIHQWP